MDPVTLQLLIKAGAPVALAVVKLLREWGAEQDATEIETALARADANFDLVIARGTTTGPLPEPDSVDEGRG